MPAHQDEMAADIGGARLVVGVAVIQVPNIVRLEDEDHRPVYARDYGIECERCRAVVVLAPDGVTSLIMAAVCWSGEGVVCTRNDDGQPSDDGEDLVGDQIGV